MRYIRQPLGPFHVLVGLHASGKSTFLDVIAFLGKLVSDGLETAIFYRTWNIKDLIWGREGNGFELAIEAAIPGDRHALLGDKEFDAIRYEIEIEIDVEPGEFTIKNEKVALKKTDRLSKIQEEDQRDLFPDWKGSPPGTIISPGHQRMTRTIVHKGPQGNANFYSEVHPASGKGWSPSFKLGAQKSALANLPEDESKFSASTWLKKFLIKREKVPGKNVNDGSGEVEGYIDFCQHLNVDMNCWGIRADRSENYIPQNLTIEELSGNYLQKIKKVQVDKYYYK